MEEGTPQRGREPDNYRHLQSMMERRITNQERLLQNQILGKKGWTLPSEQTTPNRGEGRDWGSSPGTPDSNLVKKTSNRLIEGVVEGNHPAKQEGETDVEEKQAKNRKVEEAYDRSFHGDQEDEKQVGEIIAMMEERWEEENQIKERIAEGKQERTAEFMRPWY